MNYVILLICLVGGYLLGSLNTSVIVSKIKGQDIRTAGSGNAGATNTLRVMGKGVAAFVLLCDIVKAVLAVLLARLSFHFFPSADYAYLGELLAGFGAILGHNFPLYFGFRGGKGVATSFGAILILDWRIALIILTIFIVVVALTRYVSLASSLAAVGVVVSACFLHQSLWEMLAFAAMGVLCILRHKKNIRRLMDGTENKLGQKKKEESSSF